ncbi:uncharacterized protein LOC119079710 [Bradysia coprophila]|uniref:uncharacterized protein LOC119079710 n=1 Tax=Bradysia coprophila TaxID=38358 RepID=UPI00187D922F|nr:uncharacterized protein LOC119079710 [Bradysia coprophila]
MTPDPKVLFTRKWMLANHKSPAPFQQEKFDTIFSSQSIQKHVEDLKNSIDIELYISPRLLPEDSYINLEIYSHKHPHIPINLSRVATARSCHNDDSNALIIVKDVRIAGNKLAKPERTISHYETLFRNNGIDQKLITFMPLSQLLNDYAGYEERRKLAFLYEQFIVDKDIAAKVNAFLGTKLLHEGRAAFPADFSDHLTLADKIHKALRMVYCMYTQPTDDQESKSIIRVGRHGMANEHIVENIIDLLHQLQELHPGGCNNVSRLVIRASSDVGKPFEIYKDEAGPVYPEEAATTDENSPANKSEVDESLLQKVYVHTSIIPNDHIVPDKEEDSPNDVRRDNSQPQAPPKAQNVPANLEQQVLNCLKQYVAKSNMNMNANNAPGMVTANRVIKRRRVPVAGPGNRNGKMF